MKRVSAAIRGAVQGVGFRPFIFRIATELRLTGWVLNSPQGVFIEAEGDEKLLHAFIQRIADEKPPHSFIQSFESAFLDPVGYSSFEIRASEQGGEISAFILPDIATCPECLKEIFDPLNRRYRYPFTNCTNCGPRYTIVEELPYDRPNTSMKMFMMCPECLREYGDPSNRRFHAQPNGCPACGPQLTYLDNKGSTLPISHEPIIAAADAVRSGRIVAVKGIGGFHLVADARNTEAVRLLRKRKGREEKPFALMLPSIKVAKNLCILSEIEEQLLKGSEAPIVLAMKKEKSLGEIAASVAPGNPYLGIMLPYSPLHHLLMNELKNPIVATSGNLSDEPICKDELEAVQRLSGIADNFLVHNRPIVRAVDDSVVRIMCGRPMMVRRARGYAPLPVPVSIIPRRSYFAVGAQLKNCAAFSRSSDIFISQHIGDMEAPESLEAFKRTAADLQRLYKIDHLEIVSDMHPGYLSTKEAAAMSGTVVAIQHHFAHIQSCMAENRISAPVLGAAWDGTGYGPDGTVWGGEFLIVENGSYRRFASFRQFPLPGGEKAVKEPRRSAAGILYEMFGEEFYSAGTDHWRESLSVAESKSLGEMMTKKIHSPRTSSAGRLFDAVAGLIGVRSAIRYEGQAAMELEFAIDGREGAEMYSFEIRKAAAAEPTGDSLLPEYEIDWKKIIEGVIDDCRANYSVAEISVRFHNTLVEIITAVARIAKMHKIVLSGGCFQNKYLTEKTVENLTRENFQCYWHQRVPPNDGGIAFGQIAAAVYLEDGGAHD